MNRTGIKICGITSEEDAASAVRAGADAIGLNFFEQSVRFVPIATARAIVAGLPPTVETFAVFVNAAPERVLQVLAETGIRSIQLHGSEPPKTLAALASHRVLRAVAWKGDDTPAEIESYIVDCQNLGHSPAGVLLDTYRPGRPGGTGAVWAWNELGDWRPTLPLYLAGGLTAENVGAAVRAVQPFAVDVAGGVEDQPGKKSARKIQAFCDAVRAANGK